MFFSARARRRTISSRFHPEYISGKFLLAAGCASKHERLVLFSASRKDSLLRKGDLAPTPNPSEMLTGRCVPELRLLENGREDRTPVRAVRRAAFG